MEIGIIELIRSLDSGRVADDLQCRLLDVLGAVKANHKKGKVVLTFEVKPANDENGFSRVEIRADVSFKAPLPTRRGKEFFLDEGMGIPSRHPHQPELPENVIDAVDLDDKRRAAGER